MIRSDDNNYIVYLTPGRSWDYNDDGRLIETEGINIITPNGSLFHAIPPYRVLLFCQTKIIYFRI